MFRHVGNLEVRLTITMMVVDEGIGGARLWWWLQALITGDSAFSDCWRCRWPRMFSRDSEIRGIDINTLIHRM
jgi:hypothetical protein